MSWDKDSVNMQLEMWKLKIFRYFLPPLKLAPVFLNNHLFSLLAYPRVKQIYEGGIRFYCTRNNCFYLLVSEWLVRRRDVQNKPRKVWSYFNLQWWLTSIHVSIMTFFHNNFLHLWFSVSSVMDSKQCRFKY